MENKREAYRKYLEDGGVVDMLTQVLVSLYEEPGNPRDPLEFVQAQLSAPGTADLESLRRENRALEARAKELRAHLEELKSKAK